MPIREREPPAEMAIAEKRPTPPWDSRWEALGETPLVLYSESGRVPIFGQG